MGASQPVSPSSLSDRELLRHLSTDGDERQEAVWTEFLRRYSDLMLKVAWEFVSHRDAAMELYLHVCERLAADDFAKLRAYDPTRGQEPAKISTWLVVVVRNLCIEHRRQAEGRRRYPQAVAEQPALDRKVFELYFWEGRSPREIVRELEAHPEHDPDAVPAALERLRALDLRPSKAWARHPAHRREALEDALYGSPDPPDTVRSETDRQQWIERLLDELPPKERLAVRWYYWTGMSASGISRLLQVSQRTVYTLLNRALGTLREQIGTPSADSQAPDA